MTGLRGAALVVRFLLELLALVALVYSGVAIVDGAGGWFIGVAAALLAAVLWGSFVAPRAPRPLPTIPRLGVEAVVFVAATVGLLIAGAPVAGGLLFGLYLLDRLALWASGAPAFESHPV